MNYATHILVEALKMEVNRLKRKAMDERFDDGLCLEQDESGVYICNESSLVSDGGSMGKCMKHKNAFNYRKRVCHDPIKLQQMETYRGAMTPPQYNAQRRKEVC